MDNPTRRLVVCFDGTWNSPDKGDSPTNVLKMVRAVQARDHVGTSQIVYYDKGVGTAGGTDRILGGALGAGLTANIMDGYRFLANNYCRGDEIYIFGFSRGAYTARSLAGVIGLAGLLDPGELGRPLLKVMEICQSHSNEASAKIKALKLKGHDDVTVTCLGVWDTVGALGIPTDLGQKILEETGLFNGLRKYSFPDLDLGKHINVALHAVAIDEKRGTFPPALWLKDKDTSKRKAKDTAREQTVEQVWFAGAHSNIGGSYTDSRLSDIAFYWMAQRVSEHTGLKLSDVPQESQVRQYVTGRSIDSRSGLSSHIMPYQRLINQVIPPDDGIDDYFRNAIPTIDRRNIAPDGKVPINECLHISVLERWSAPAVEHDCEEDKACAAAPYRPETLAATINARHQGRPIPVVGWDGEVMPDAAAPWPNVAETVSA